jgi:integrase
MQPRPGGSHDQARSYLSELIDIANGTGRRLSAICSLTLADLRLSEGPNGSIRWPAETSKNGEEAVVPIDRDVRAAIDRRLSGTVPIPSPAPLFPFLADPSRPIGRHLAHRWLRAAEKLAGLEPLQGSAWHAFRRKFASEMQYEAPTVVADLGGWKDVAIMQRAYQHANPEMMSDVLSRRRVYREGRK